MRERRFSQNGVAVLRSFPAGGVPRAPVVIRTRSFQLWAKTWTLASLVKTWGRERVSLRAGADYRSLQLRTATLARYAAKLGTETPFYLANNPVPASLWACLPKPRKVRERATADLTRWWIGPAGSGGQLHCDLADNVIYQIVGRKQLLLCPPRDRARLSVRAINAGLHASPVDLTRLDLRRYPAAAGASVQHLVLNPGDLLFLPSGWFHQVLNLESSCSVNYFLLPA